MFPGEYSASLGGNVATNAGGMRAVKYGVTRHHVLGLEAVLGLGRGDPQRRQVREAATGYDLTQLIIGSEGTLALVTEATLGCTPARPRRHHPGPFATLDEVTAAVPALVRSGVGPLILEYIDMLTMAAATQFVGLDLGIPSRGQGGGAGLPGGGAGEPHADRLEEDTARWPSCSTTSAPSTSTCPPARPRG